MLQAPTGIKIPYSILAAVQSSLILPSVLSFGVGKISGGFEQETNELRAFIKKHDPDYRVDSEGDVLLWLYKKSGIKFSYLYATDNNILNNFRLSDGTTIYNETLMAMLRERFGE